jgi:hypothetical protein
MTTFAEYLAAQDTMNDFRTQALERVVAYVKSGKSEAGEVAVGGPKQPRSFSPNFAAFIRPDKNNHVLVNLNPVGGRFAVDTIKVPMSVLEAD